MCVCGGRVHIRKKILYIHIPLHIYVYVCMYIYIHVYYHLVYAQYIWYHMWRRIRSTGDSKRIGFSDLQPADHPSHSLLGICQESLEPGLWSKFIPVVVRILWALNYITHGIHGAAIYGNMDPINISSMLAYIPYMDPMGTRLNFWTANRYLEENTT